MPIELQFIQVSDFMRFGADEHFDFEASRLALGELARACRKGGICQAILDLRGVKLVRRPVFTFAQVTSLLYTFYEGGFSTEPRVAVLCTDDPNLRVSWFAFIGRIHGWNVAAFDNFDEALLWLAGGRADDFNIHGDVHGSVPIKLKRRPAGGLERRKAWRY